MKLSNRYKVLFVACLMVFIALLLGIVYLLQVQSNKKQAEHTATILIDQIKSSIVINKKREAKLLNTLKEDYIIRAKGISYILDQNPKIAWDVQELVKIAELSKVDEIHILDETGTICGGNLPKYFGYSIDSGEQIAYFEPMLHDKTLSMCQDLTPNTAEGKPMMYAMCWNQDGTYMLQVGIEPKRLIEELRANDIYEIIRGLTLYDGLTVVAADNASGQILGATVDKMVGQTLDDIGLDMHGDNLEQIHMFEGLVNGQRSYYTVHASEPYLLAIVQERAVVDIDIPFVMTIIVVYIFVMLSISLFVIFLIARHAEKVRKQATVDIMTGLPNRRAYESCLSCMKTSNKGSVEENLVYVSLDLNGLKESNDTMGHAAGDELIRAAAQCILESFGAYGKVFRVGGDEFAAIIHVDEGQMEQIRDNFEEISKTWHGKYIKGVSVSCGYAQGKEFPEKTLAEIMEIADKRMYLAKQEYYRAHDRRGRDA